MRVLTEAAATDPDLAEAARRLEDQRHAGMGRFARDLADRGFLRTDLTIDEAQDMPWTLNSYAVHDMLVDDRG